MAGTSVQEIDRLIAELQTLREMLSIEGARVQREIVAVRDLEPVGDAVDQDHRREPVALEEGAGRSQHPRRLSFERLYDGKRTTAADQVASSIVRHLFHPPVYCSTSL